MRFRTHAITSALAGIALYPRSPLRAAAVLLSGTLIDLDHLALYSFQTGDWSMTGALAYDRYRHLIGVAGDTRPRYDGLRSWLHKPLVLLPPLWALAVGRPALRPVAIGAALRPLRAIRPKADGLLAARVGRAGEAHPLQTLLREERAERRRQLARRPIEAAGCGTLTAEVRTMEERRARPWMMTNHLPPSARRRAKS
jgi:hypothetical protein